VTNGFGIYVHIPFCVHKCSYCDFYSFTKYASDDFARYTSQLVREIEESGKWLVRERGHAAPVASIFFGGGTPSLLPADQYARIFAAIFENFSVSSDAEITTEANPETVNESVLEGWREKTPINRVSMGAQSFRAEFLTALERLGKKESIVAASEALRKFNYTNFNLDLIFGIPGQDKTKMVEDIEAAASLGPEHISSYSLTLKPGHKLYGSLPDDDAAADLYEVAVDRLEALRYRRYEISNFSIPGKESRHNLLYWTGGDYLGVGTSAASRFFWDGNFHHRKQVSDYSQYTELQNFDPKWETTTPAQTLLEATFLELRTSEGVDVALFERKYGKDLRQGKNFGLYEREKLLEFTGRNIKLTPRGMMLAESVVQGLV
jgi:oxygen-independent coproporphyrinogen III oxidase